MQGDLSERERERKRERERERDVARLCHNNWNPVLHILISYTKIVQIVIYCEGTY